MPHTIPMANITITTVPVRPATLAAAAAAFAAYREDGGGSNRSALTAVRTIAVLAACMEVLATGQSVNLTDSFPRTGKTAPYYLLHRVLGTGVIRDGYWRNVKITPLKGATWNGNEVTGEESSNGDTVLLSIVK